MESNEQSYKPEEAAIRLLGLEIPLAEDEIAGYILELPEKFDYSNDYLSLKEFIEINNYKNLTPGETPIHLMLFIKEKILKIPSVSNNPVANIIIHQAVFGCLYMTGYLSALELMLQLTKWIVRIKNLQANKH